MKCRVIYNQDKTIMVMYPAYNLKHNDETEDSFIKRICDRDMMRQGIQNLDYEDIDDAQLPNRGKRYAWRGDKISGLKVDNTIKNPSIKEDKLQRKMRDIAAMTLKSEGDPDFQ